MHRTSLQKALVRTGLTTIIALVAMSSFAVQPTFAEGPTLLKRTLVIQPWRLSSYWRDKKAESPEWNTWSWIPRVKFRMIGPIAGGSQVTVDYTYPDGKLWMSEDLYTEELADGYYGTFETTGNRTSAMEQAATLKTGLFGYTIKLTNELTGVNDVLMSGKFKVDKIHVGIPSRPNENEYFVDQDWRLPIGYVWIEENYLHIGCWIRGNDWRTGQYSGHLLYNGKPIMSTGEDGSSVGFWHDILTMGNRESDPAWTQAIFQFTGVIPTNAGLEGRTDLHFMTDNPGDYELKMLFGGKTVRSMKFSIGTDGKFVDNGIATNNRFGENYLVIPVTVTGEMDGKWNRNAWKDEAFYYNPLSGFTAQ